MLILALEKMHSFQLNQQYGALTPRRRLLTFKIDQLTRLLDIRSQMTKLFINSVLKFELCSKMMKSDILLRLAAYRIAERFSVIWALIFFLFKIDICHALWSKVALFFNLFYLAVVNFTNCNVPNLCFFRSTLSFLTDILTKMILSTTLDK